MIWREIRRFFKSSPLLSISAAVVLAIGMGGSALALALLFAFSAMTYPGMRNAGYAIIAEETQGGGSVPISWARIEKLQASSPGATFYAYSQLIHTTITRDGNSSPVSVVAVSSGFFSGLAAPLRVGRDFTKSEESEGRVAILSGTLAAQLFHFADKAIHQYVVLDGAPYQVVGVAPPGFGGLFGDSADAWVPAHCVIPLLLKLPPEFLKADPNIWKTLGGFYAVASSRQLSSGNFAAQLSRTLPLRLSGEASLHASQGLTRNPVQDAKVRKWLRMGLLLALIFTLVSSLNFSLLLLARTPRHVEEVRLKRALGAGSGRLFAELMIGPVTTLAVALAGSRAIWIFGLRFTSAQSPFFGQLVCGSWHDAALAFGIQLPLACILTVLIASIPGFSLLRENVMPWLGYASTAPRRTDAILQALVIFEIAFCTATWILAGMVVSAAASLVRQPLGYDSAHLSIVSIGPGSGQVNFTGGGGRSFPETSAVKSLIERVAAVPGMRSVSFGGEAPFGGAMDAIKVQTMDGGSIPRTAFNTSAGPGYFRSLGARMLAGEEFTWNRFEASANEVIVNQTLANELWPHANPLNQSIRLIFPARYGLRSFTSVKRVIGIAEDIRFGGFAEPPGPVVFESVEGAALVDSFLIANGDESLQALENAAKPVVAQQMPGLSVQRGYSTRNQVQASLRPEEKRAEFIFAGALAMALIAYIGLYGALVYYVGTRRRELAVRMCLGATSGTIRKMILIRAGRCAIFGAALSLPLWPLLAGLSANDYLGKLSWSLSRADFLAFACITVSVLIALIPAAAATRVSPAEILRGSEHRRRSRRARK